MSVPVTHYDANGPLESTAGGAAFHVRRPQGAQLPPLLDRPRLLRPRPPRGVRDLRMDRLGGLPPAALSRLPGPGPGRAAWISTQRVGQKAGRGGVSRAGRAAAQ